MVQFLANRMTYFPAVWQHFHPGWQFCTVTCFQSRETSCNGTTFWALTSLEKQHDYWWWVGLVCWILFGHPSLVECWAGTTESELQVCHDISTRMSGKTCSGTCDWKLSIGECPFYWKNHIGEEWGTRMILAFELPMPFSMRQVLAQTLWEKLEIQF